MAVPTEVVELVRAVVVKTGPANKNESTLAPEEVDVT
jgi:hypothetical protein